MAEQGTSYEISFSDDDGGLTDAVVVRPTGAVGPSGSPVYRDQTGIIQVEINDRGEARLLPTSAFQRPLRPAGCRRVPARTE